MKTTEIIQQNFIDILNLRKWSKTETNSSRYLVFTPPSNLLFDNSYKLYLPKNVAALDFETNIYKLLEILRDIYIEDIDELVSIVIDDKEILKFHIEDDNVYDGKISIPHFNSLLEKIKKVLQEAASFTILNKPHILDKIEETERYLNHCKFLKNSKGSIITKIELPKNEEIKESTLFEKSVIGSEINKKAIDVISFVNNDLLVDNIGLPDENFLLSNREFINVNLIDAVRELYTEIDFANIDLELKSSRTDNRTFAKEITKQKVETLKSFTKVVREKINEILDLQLYGKIVQLSSKDVESDKNIIKVEAMVKNVKSFISVTLSSSEYKLAISAHEDNKTVMLDGIFDKEKTQFKVVELKNFRVL